VEVFAELHLRPEKRVFEDAEDTYAKRLRQAETVSEASSDAVLADLGAAVERDELDTENEQLRAACGRSDVEIEMLKTVCGRKDDEIETLKVAAVEFEARMRAKDAEISRLKDEVGAQQTVVDRQEIAIAAFEAQADPGRMPKEALEAATHVRLAGHTAAVLRQDKAKLRARVHELDMKLEAVKKTNANLGVEVARLAGGEGLLEDRHRAEVQELQRQVEAANSARDAAQRLVDVGAAKLKAADDFIFVLKTHLEEQPVGGWSIMSPLDALKRFEITRLEQALEDAAMHLRARELDVATEQMRNFALHEMQKRIRTENAGSIPPLFRSYFAFL
jgi:chromosome segregation ATPase